MKFLIVGCIVLLLLASAMGVGYAADKGIPIDEKHFPDPVFRDIVLTRCDVDYDGYLSNNEITRKVNMNLDNLPAKQVTSLQGIEYFTELKTIYTSVSKKAITNCLNGAVVDLTKNKKLQIVDLHGSGIKELNVSNLQNLTGVDCDFCNLEKINVLNCPKLNKLYCNYNLLKTLDLSGTYPELYTLEAADNRLYSVTLGYCPSLRILDLHYNKIASLDISQCDFIVRFTKESPLKETGDNGQYLNYSGGYTGFKVDNNVELKKDKPKVTSITLNVKTLYMRENTTYQLEVTILPKEAAGCMIVWGSTNGKVVSLADGNGKITAKKLGKAKITAIAQDGSGMSASCTVYVKKPIEISSKTWNLGFGEQVTIKAETAGGRYSKTFSSSNEDVATIDRYGTITAKNIQGETVITAEVTIDGKKYEDHHKLWVYGAGKYSGFTSTTLKEAKKYANKNLASVVDVFYNALSKKADDKIKKVQDSVELLIVISPANVTKNLPENVQNAFKEKFTAAVKEFRRDVKGFEDCKTNVDVVKRIGQKLCDNQNGKITFKADNKKYEATIISNGPDSAGLYSGTISYEGRSYLWAATDKSSKKIEDEMKFLKSYSDSKLDEAKEAVKKDVEELLNISDIKEALSTWTKGKAKDILKKESADLYDYVKRAEDIAKKYDEVKSKMKGITPPDLTGKLESDVIKEIAGYGTKFQEFVDLIENMPDVISF